MHSSMRPFRQALVEHRNAHPDKVSNLSRKPACPAFFSVRPYSSVITPEYHYLHTHMTKFWHRGKSVSLMRPLGDWTHSTAVRQSSVYSATSAKRADVQTG
jgi:hypothetical protein